MNDYQKQFLDWLEKNPDKKKGLTEWKDLAKIIDEYKMKTNKSKNRETNLEIQFTQAMYLSREWQNNKNLFLEYWKVFYWWAVTEKHDFSGLSLTFYELDYFIRHYQNSTEELVTEVKQLKSEKKRLEDKVTGLEEALEIERETNQESAEMMDDFYRRQFIENQTPNILKEFSEDYLKTSWENQIQKKEIQELKTALSLAEQLANLKIQEEQTEAQIQVPPK